MSRDKTGERWPDHRAWQLLFRYTSRPQIDIIGMPKNNPNKAILNRILKRALSNDHTYTKSSTGRRCHFAKAAPVLRMYVPDPARTILYKSCSRAHHAREIVEGSSRVDLDRIADVVPEIDDWRSLSRCTDQKSVPACLEGRQLVRLFCQAHRPYKAV